MINRFAFALALAFPLLPISAGTAVAQSASEEAAGTISFTESNAASVTAIYAGNAADVIVLGAGYEQNFCTGAFCRVERAGVPVAEIIIAEASRERAAALIIQLENNQTIQTGDTVKLKTI